MTPFDLHVSPCTLLAPSFHRCITDRNSKQVAVEKAYDNAKASGAHEEGKA